MKNKHILSGVMHDPEFAVTSSAAFGVSTSPPFGNMGAPPSGVMDMTALEI